MTPLQQQSDALKAKLLKDLVPVVYPAPMGLVPAGAVFWKQR